MFIQILILTMTLITTASAHQNLSLLREHNPFSYDLGIKIIPSKIKNADVTICCHGYGHNNQIVDVVHSFNIIPGILIGFNFPDYNITPAIDHTKAAYGTIKEILPLLYILKRCVHDLQLKKINLYGFSAGAGAIINALAALNQTRFDTELHTIGITQAIKKEIINALEKGLIILDCPLKSCEEIIDLRGKSPEFEILASNYKKNSMRQIDSLQFLAGLQLNILLHFQKPDQILGNRDDTLFIERLQKANKGTTTVVVGFDGGHNTMHRTLWNAYKKLQGSALN